MANIVKYQDGNAAPPFPTTLLSGANLQNTSNNALSANSSTFDNLTQKDLKADLLIHLDALSPGSNAHVDIYILVAKDSTPNFPAPAAADLRLMTSMLWCSVPIGATASTAEDIIVRGLDLPDAKFQVVLDNQTGVSIPNNTNSFVKIQTYNFSTNN